MGQSISETEQWNCDVWKCVNVHKTWPWEGRLTALDLHRFNADGEPKRWWNRSNLFTDVLATWQRTFFLTVIDFQNRSCSKRQISPLKSQPFITTSCDIGISRLNDLKKKNVDIITSTISEVLLLSYIHTYFHYFRWILWIWWAVHVKDLDLVGTVKRFLEYPSRYDSFIWFLDIAE
jgi:hypothetical protein